MVEAAPVTGKFTLTGKEDVRVGIDFINFGQFPDIFDTPIGDVVFLTGTETFAGIAGTDGTIKDLVALPVDTPIVVNNFIVMFARPTLDFTLTELVAGVGTPDRAPCPRTRGTCARSPARR